MPYFFNVATGKVEELNDPERARAQDLLGPYPNRAAAEAALATARARSEAWDEEDRREEEWRTGDRPSD